MTTLMAAKMHKTKNDLPKGVREKMIAVLQERLFDAIDLQAQAKQAHWNVKGPNFIGLHELFDKIYEGMTDPVDEMAERIAMLGGTPMGTVRRAGEGSSLKEYPGDIFSGKEHVEALSSALADFGGKVRDMIDIADKAGDMDTSDLCTGISQAIDKWLWFVEAHAQANS